MRVVIIGSGPAGITVAERLRRYRKDVDIILLAAEPGPPYAPPAMADYFLTGRTQMLFWKDRDICERLGIDLQSGVAVSMVRPATRVVETESGVAIPYDRLVIASGSNLYAPIEGCDLEEVYNFKSLTAASALVARVRQGHVHQAVIVGAGFIGVEVALLLRELGLSVTLLEMADRIMPKMLDTETADIVRASLDARGIHVRLETKVSAFAGNGQVARVELEKESVPGNVFVAATGLKPNVAFLRDSGIDVGWGIQVDNRLRTNVSDIYGGGEFR